MLPRPEIIEGNPSAFVAIVGTSVGMLLAFIGVFLPWYEFSFNDGRDSSVVIGGLDAGGGKVIVMVVAAVLALGGLLLDPSRNRWLLGATFTISALVAAEFSQVFTLEAADAREGVWLGLIGGIVSALANAAAVVFSPKSGSGAPSAEAQLD